MRRIAIFTAVAVMLLGGISLAQVFVPPLGPNNSNMFATPLGVCSNSTPAGPCFGSGGGGPATLAPTVTGVSPNIGTTAGGTTVTITGTQFTGATVVVFGATNAASFTVLSSGVITAVTPAHSAATVDVRVTNPIGQSPINSPADNFTFSTCTNSLDFSQACNSQYVPSLF